MGLYIASSVLSVTDMNHANCLVVLYEAAVSFLMPHALKIHCSSPCARNKGHIVYSICLHWMIIDTETLALPKLQENIEN